MENKKSLNQIQSFSTIYLPKFWTAFLYHKLQLSQRNWFFLYIRRTTPKSVQIQRSWRRCEQLLIHNTTIVVEKYLVIILLLFPSTISLHSCILKLQSLKECMVIFIKFWIMFKQSCHLFLFIKKYQFFVASFWTWNGPFIFIKDTFLS